MKLFSNPLAFVAFLGVLAVEVDHEKHQALERAAKIVESEAKRVIGTYDYGWPQLAQSTIDSGNPNNTPLLRTGELRDSIEHTVHDSVAEIGSNLDQAVWQELGTSHIPPRPFLAGALNAKITEIVQVIGQDVVGVMKGRNHNVGL